MSDREPFRKQTENRHIKLQIELDEEDTTLFVNNAICKLN